MTRLEGMAALMAGVAMSALLLAGRAPASAEPPSSFDPAAPQRSDLECPTPIRTDIHMTKDGARDPVDGLESLDLAEVLTPRTVGVPVGASFYSADLHANDVGYAVIVEARRPADGSLGGWIEVDYHAAYDRWLPGYAAFCMDMVE